MHENFTSQRSTNIEPSVSKLQEVKFLQYISPQISPIAAGLSHNMSVCKVASTISPILSATEPRFEPSLPMWVARNLPLYLSTALWTFLQDH